MAFTFEGAEHSAASATGHVAIARQADFGVLLRLAADARRGPATGRRGQVDSCTPGFGQANGNGLFG